LDLAADVGAVPLRRIIREIFAAPERDETPDDTITSAAVVAEEDLASAVTISLCLDTFAASPATDVVMVRQQS